MTTETEERMLRKLLTEEEKYNARQFALLIKELESVISNKIFALHKSSELFKDSLTKVMTELLQACKVDLSTGVVDKKESFLELVGPGSISTMLADDFGSAIRLVKLVEELKELNNGENYISKLGNDGTRLVIEIISKSKPRAGYMISVGNSTQHYSSVVLAGWRIMDFFNLHDR